MLEKEPTLEEWRKLYQAAIRLKETAPWEWMYETDVFGVHNPETEELGFVSVMGMFEQHFALALYIGPENLTRFWAMQESEDSENPEHLLETHQLQASFEDRSELTNQDRKVITQLGLHFRGRKSWPLFRSFRPGYFPWYVEAAEVRFLTHAVEQAVEVALRLHEDPDTLNTPADDCYLVRIPREEKNTLVWEDKTVTVLPADSTPTPVPIDTEKLEELGRSPRSHIIVEMDFFPIPTCIEEKGTRPFIPYTLLLVDGSNGQILGNELHKPDPNLETLWDSIPNVVMEQLIRMGILPYQIHVQSARVSELLQPLALELGFEVKTTPSLRNLNVAKDFLRQRFLEG